MIDRGRTRPRHRDVVRRDRRRGRARWTRDPVERHRVAGRAARAVRRRRPGDRRRARTSSRCRSSSTRHCAKRASRMRDLDGDRRDAGAGPDRRAARRLCGGQGDGRGARRPVLWVCTTSKATSSRTSSETTRSQPPFVALVVSGGHTSLYRRPRARHVRAPRPDRGRRGRGGLRQDRALPRPRLPRRPGDRQALEARRPERPIAFPRAMLRDGLDFSFSGLKTAVVRHVREQRGRGEKTCDGRRRRLVPGGDRGRPGHARHARGDATSGSDGS